jgi:hypothetical protein
VVCGDGTLPCLFSHESARPERIPGEVAELFGAVDSASGDYLIAFAWAMADQLEKLGR